MSETPSIQPTEVDAVNHPPHYKQGPIEVCVLNGFVPISIQIEEADNIGLGFLVDDQGFVELGGGDA